MAAYASTMGPHGALACIALLASPRAVPRVFWSGKVSGARTLMVATSQGARATSLRLPAWATIDETLVSPKSDYAFVFAKRPREKRTAYFVRIEDGSVTGSFRPGVGGQFWFTQANTVVQEAGCGTECAGVMIHLPNGSTPGRFVCAGFDESHELSPSRRYVSCFNRGTVRVIDTSSGQVVREIKTPCPYGDRAKVAWLRDESTFQFQCFEADRQATFRSTTALRDQRSP